MTRHRDPRRFFRLIDYLRVGNEQLTRALDGELVLSHLFFVGEVACGYIRNRRAILAQLLQLPAVVIATHDEVMSFIDAKSLMARGIGYVDIHLLASVVLTDDAQLWTRDHRLRAVATDLGLAHE